MSSGSREWKKNGVGNPFQCHGRHILIRPIGWRVEREGGKEAREGIKSLNLAVHLHETEKHSTSDKAVTKNLMRVRINCEFCCLLLNFHGELNAGTIKINSNVANNKHSFADYVLENNITRTRGAIKNLHSGSLKKFACNLFEFLLICISFRKTLKLKFT